MEELPIRDKMQELDDFIEQNKHLPAQGTEQWLRDRKFTIGGSEMSVITGDNPYKKIRGLIEEHIGLKTFKGNINTVWGSVLEDLAILILERIWCAKVYETGSITGAVPGQKYSPDGLVYLSFADLLILLEIKCPIRRVPTGKVPKHYLPQILTGLESIPMVDIAIFVDTMLRRCSLKVHNLQDNTYDLKVHSDKPVQAPLALYMVVIYGEHKTYPIIDLGSCDSWILTNILFKVKDGLLKREFIRDQSQITILGDKIDPIIFEYCGINIVGLLPLKLFKLDLTPVQRQVGYVNIYADKIADTIEKIRQLDVFPDKQKKIELEKQFPGRRTKMINQMAKDMEEYLKRRRARA